LPLLTKDFISRLGALEIVSRRIRRGRFRGERRSTRRGSSVEFADHRPYAIGDDVRFLDWNMYARLDRLVTKLFHDEEDLAVHLVLDRSASMDFGDPTKALYAKRILAALGYVALLGMNRVILWSPGEGGEIDVRDLRSARSAARLFEVLDAAPVGGNTGLGEPLRRWAGTRRPRGIVVVASDFMHPDGAWEHLRPLARGGIEVHCVRVLTIEEESPDVLGDLRLVDSETGGGVDVTVTPKLLRLYREARSAYDRRLDEYCRSRQMTLLTSVTSAPFESLVLESLRRKGLLR
jgi:uncharacterized protein (DUF58 family)